MSEELYSYLQRFKPMADKAACSLSCSGEDLLHDTYLKCFEYFEKFPDKRDLANPRGFAYLALKRIIIDKRKYDSYRDGTELNGEEPSTPSVEEEAISLELSPAMQVAIDTINTNFSDTLWLHYVAELTAQDIADLQRVPLGTVLTRLHRGRKELRKRFDKERIKGVN